MSEQRVPYITQTAPMPLKIEYTDNAPDMRQWLCDLRRDLLRKVKQIDELVARLPIDS